jgi:hypothetical protein
MVEVGDGILAADQVRALLARTLEQIAAYNARRQNGRVPVPAGCGSR